MTTKYDVLIYNRSNRVVPRALAERLEEYTDGYVRAVLKATIIAVLMKEGFSWYQAQERYR